MGFRRFELSDKKLAEKWKLFGNKSLIRVAGFLLKFAIKKGIDGKVEVRVFCIDRG